MKANNYRGTKWACYLTNVSMAAIGSMSPILFTTFRELYNVSYTLLGLLTATFFMVQLGVDLIFTFFSKKFNLRLTVMLMPLVTLAGVLVYALMPRFFPNAAYLWIIMGTAIFAAGAGLTEVLASPVVAAIPAENKDREMSKLHSSYAWGLVAVVIVGTLLLKLVGREMWIVLPLAYSVFSAVAFILFLISPFPDMKNGEEETQGEGKNRTRVFSFGLLLCAFCIFLGGASECTMTGWISGYMEVSLGIPKIVGDICGMALFALALSIGRTLYASRGKNILRVMILGMIGAAVCYAVAALSPIGAVGVAASVVTGFAVSMLWPGTIILVGEKFPAAGVAAYALMAAGGDFGASVAPQLMGIIADRFGYSSFGLFLSEKLSMTSEVIGMRAGMLIGALFPLFGFFLLLFMKRYFSRGEKSDCIEENTKNIPSSID